jgi:hypothetical protein
MEIVEKYNQHKFQSVINKSGGDGPYWNAVGNDISKLKFYRKP